MFFKACTIFERQKQDCMTIFLLQIVIDIIPCGSSKTLWLSSNGCNPATGTRHRQMDIIDIDVA